jgi:quinoprotein glucose dehydrogenase
MSRHARRIILASAALTTVLVLVGTGVTGQSRVLPSTKNGEWPHYTADLKGSRYSPLDQINASNFDRLQVAWRFKTDSLGTRPEYKLEGTPLMIGRTIYTTAGTRRAVVALDARTGELLWVHRYPEGRRGALAPRQLSGRGLSYWTDGKGDDRVLYVTPGYRLIALDAKTGAMVKSFGQDGLVDLKVGVVFGENQQIDLETGDIGLHSTPTVVKDMVIVGSSMKEGMTVTTHNNAKGLVRAFDVRTGRKIWQFNPIPRPGELGNETWLNDSWKINGNTGVWTQITVDEELGLVYLPVESPTSDFYGGKRPGDNLFGESLVCVDLKTGKYKWHFQFVHHAIWDHDMSSAPLLMDITVGGKPIKAVAVPSKQSYLYVFDRVTGKPVWDIVETPVPQGDVPGEWYAKTQPIPTKPPAYGRPGMRIPDDLIDFTPELRAQALENLKRYKWGGDYPYNGTLYNPPIIGDVKGLLGAINIGNASGGTNWPGGGFDPETQIVYAPANMGAFSPESISPPPQGFSDLPYQAGVVGEPFRLREAAGTGTYADAPDRPEPPPQAAGAGRGGSGRSFGTVEGLSILKPPYGVLAAIDVNKGDLLWQAPHGDTPAGVLNHPALKGRDIPKTGQSGSVGLVVTKTLVIMGDPQTTAVGGARLRAYDKATGRQVGAVRLPAQQSGSPMTYLVDGRQYIIVAVSGGGYSGEYISFALPPQTTTSADARR